MRASLFHFLVVMIVVSSLDAVAQPGPGIVVQGKFGGLIFGFDIDPNCSLTPTGCDAAMPSAIVVRASSSASKREHAAAAPSMPVDPVMCQPRS